jgi:hypothetical protein
MSASSAGVAQSESVVRAIRCQSINLYPHVLKDGVISVEDQEQRFKLAMLRRAIKTLRCSGADDVAEAQAQQPLSVRQAQSR